MSERTHDDVKRMIESMSTGDLHSLLDERDALESDRSRLQRECEELKAENGNLREFIAASKECATAANLVALSDDNDRYRAAFQQIIDKFHSGEHSVRAAFCSWCSEAWPHLEGDTKEATRQYAREHAFRCVSHPMRIERDALAAKLAEAERENERMRAALSTPCETDVTWHNNGRGPRVVFEVGSEDYVVTAERAKSLGAALIRAAVSAIDAALAATIRLNDMDGARFAKAIENPGPPTEVLVDLFKDDESRCAVCGWAYVEAFVDGCVRGNCSQRPPPERKYAPERAERERAALAARSKP